MMKLCLLKKYIREMPLNTDDGIEGIYMNGLEGTLEDYNKSDWK